jgi:hypothetical protein
MVRTRKPDLLDQRQFVMSLPDFQHMNRREIEDFLIEKSLIDADFRARLIADPRAALGALGLPIGPEVKIHVFVEEPGDFSIVLPRVLRDSEELAPEELETIAGGSQPDFKGFFGGYM